MSIEIEQPYPYENVSNEELYRQFGTLPKSRIEALIDKEVEFNECNENGETVTFAYGIEDMRNDVDFIADSIEFIIDDIEDDTIRQRLIYKIEELRAL